MADVSAAHILDASYANLCCLHYSLPYASALQRTLYARICIETSTFAPPV